MGTSQYPIEFDVAEIKPIAEINGKKLAQENLHEKSNFFVVVFLV